VATRSPRCPQPARPLAEHRARPQPASSSGALPDPVVTDPTVTTYINGLEIVSLAQVRLLVSSSPPALNAFAVPGGYASSSRADRRDRRRDRQRLGHDRAVHAHHIIRQQTSA
jgi:hypothetical protein